MILVTGGTGLVGSYLLSRLVQTNNSVRAIYRTKAKLDTVKKVFSYVMDDVNTQFHKIDWVEADITEIPSLEKAFTNVTHVYHCAAFVSFEPNRYRDLRKINIEGTANIVNFCIKNNIEKLCYVSSIATLGQPTDQNQLISESTAYNSEEDNSVYAITKYGAELEVWRGTQEGLNAIIVHPGIILGAGHWRGGSSGGLFKLVSKKMTYYTYGISGYVDVFDVVDMMIQLMNSSAKNEAFILVSENISFKDFLTKVSEALGVSPPRKEAKPWLLQLAWRLDWLKHKLFGKRRALSRQSAKSAITISRFDNQKIKKTLGVEFKAIDNTIDEVAKLYLKDQQ